MNSLFIQEFGILLIIVIIISFLIKILRQPIIIGYVIAGLLFSFVIPSVSSSGEQIIILSELGITFLLFLMGLEFNFKNLKYLGKDILIVAALQTIVFFFIGLGAASLFGFAIKECAYFAALFMFSSTLLVAKWVEDKKETGTLHGKLILGTLIVQDVIAILTLTTLNVVHEYSLMKIISIPLGGIALLLIAFIFAKYLLNRVLKTAVRYPELFFIFSLGICFFFVIIAPYLGYSTTIGAFIAGIVLANTMYKNDVYTRLKSFIIFFNMLFFVGLGFQMRLQMNSNIILLLILFSAMALLIKPIIIYITLRIRNYDMKSSLITGLSLAQFSEFGLIIIASGAAAGAISNDIKTMAIILIILTMMLSSYFIKYDKNIFKWSEKYLLMVDGIFPNRKAKAGIAKLNKMKYNIIFFGYYYISKELLAKLNNLNKKILVVDNDPAHIRLLKKEGTQYSYNSISNPEFFEKLNFKEVGLIVSSLTDLEDNKMIIRQLKQSNPNATAIVTARSLKHSLDLYNNDADYVIYPSYLNEQRVSVLIEDYTMDINKVISKKIGDLTKFKAMDRKRKETNGSNNFDINSFIGKISKTKKSVRKYKDNIINKCKEVHKKKIRRKYG